MYYIILYVSILIPLSLAIHYAMETLMDDLDVVFHH